MKTLIGIPTMGGIHPLLALRLIAWSHETEVYFTYKVAPVDRARNTIVKVFLAGDYTHLFFIDSDTIPPPDALDRLLAHDVPIVSAITPIYNLEDVEQRDNCYNAQSPISRYSGLQTIDACGASCLLIKREVFASLTPPYFRFIMSDDNTEVLQSEDLHFCSRLDKYTLLADTDIVCSHIKEVELL